MIVPGEVAGKDTKDAASESARTEGDVTEDDPSTVKGGSDYVVDMAEPQGGKYHVRVLIPCYKEDAEIVEKTLVAIRSAVLPPGDHHRCSNAPQNSDLLMLFLASGRAGRSGCGDCLSKRV